MQAAGEDHTLSGCLNTLSNLPGQQAPGAGTLEPASKRAGGLISSWLTAVASAAA